jgi:hypothetical protein
MEKRATRHVNGLMFILGDVRRSVSKCDMSHGRMKQNFYRMKLVLGAFG